MKLSFTKKVGAENWEIDYCDAKTNGIDLLFVNSDIYRLKYIHKLWRTPNQSHQKLHIISGCCSRL